jgi:hypothetical protein
MPLNPETGFVTLPEVVTDELAGKFGEISLFNHHADFELQSAYNSNSTSPWATACEPATQPSHEVPHSTSSAVTAAGAALSRASAVTTSSAAAAAVGSVLS